MTILSIVYYYCAHMTHRAVMMALFDVMIYVLCQFFFEE